MAFKSDKQRKKVMAELNQGSVKSETKPTLLGRLRAGEKAVAGRLRKKFRPTSQELAEQRGARLKREAEALKEEERRARQLELEAEVESKREVIRKKEKEARARLKEIDRARFERSRAGQAVTAGRGLARAGIKKLLEPAPIPKQRKRKKAKPAPEQDFFHI